jgi:hypothetical protein
MYQALSECASLHPDAIPADADEMDDLGNSGWITAENVDQFDQSQVRDAALQHLESVFGVGTRPDTTEKGQFDDADEEHINR